MKTVNFTYKETKANEKIKFKGQLLLRASAPCALFLFDGQVETLAGFGAEFDISAPQATAFKVVAPEGVRVFRRHPDSLVRKGSGKAFTNADRMPHESGALLEVRKGLREIALARKGLQQETEAALREVRRAKKALTPDDQITEDGEVIEGKEASAE